MGAAARGPRAIRLDVQPAVHPFHDLRHTYATLGLRQHVPLRLVSDALGHASIGITANLYSHVDETMRDEVAEAIDGVFDGDS